MAAGSEKAMVPSQAKTLTKEQAAELAALEAEHRSRLASVIGEMRTNLIAWAMKNQDRRIMLPKSMSAEDLEMKVQERSAPTLIPKIKDNNYEEVEINAVTKPYSYVRIKYNKTMHEYIYEVIEPQLTDEEVKTLKFVKDTLIKTLEYTFDETTHKDKEEYLRKSIDALLSARGINLVPVSRDRIAYYVIRDFIGFGKLDVLMRDPQIEDVSNDGVRIPIYVFHRKYGSIKSTLMFGDDNEVDSFVINMAQRSGKHISVAEPLLDATLPDGSRLQATLAREVTTRGSSFTIRRFRDNPFTPPDMLRFRTLETSMLAYLWLAIEHGESMLICGGTASGKTTTLNALLLFIPPQHKIITIEDTREINIPHENWIAGLTRAGFGARGSDGKAAGEIDMFELLRAALRQRPQYLMVGEVRGKEAQTLFQAMATGHTVYGTMHADSVKAMVHRLENPPIELPRILLSSLNIVLLQGQVRVGKGMSRRVKGIIEIVGIEPETNELITNTVFRWNQSDDTFVYNGHSFLYEKISNMQGLTSEQMKEEVKRREEILEWMRKTNVRNFIDVSKIISAYYKNPEETIKNVRKELYG
jgi:flagellar protein FlaI